MVQYSPEYIAYKKMLRHRRRLWLILYLGTPLLMVALFYLPGELAPAASFPVLLFSGLLWRYVYARVDICPWCGQPFSEALYNGFNADAAGPEPCCANCGEPTRSGL